MNRSSDLVCLVSGWGLIEDLSDSVRDNFIDLSSGSFQLSSACYGGRDKGSQTNTSLDLLSFKSLLFLLTEVLNCSMSTST